MLNQLRKISFPIVFIIVTVGSLLPAKDVPELIENISDKGIHFGMYLCFNISLYLFIRFIKKDSSRWKIIIFSTLISIVYGIIIELLQYYVVVGRYGDVLDVIANTIGALLAVLLIFSLRILKLKLR